MLDDASGNPPGTARGTRRESWEQAGWSDGPFIGDSESTTDVAFTVGGSVAVVLRPETNDHGDDQRRINVGLEPIVDSGSHGGDPCPVAAGDAFGAESDDELSVDDDEEHEHPAGDAAEHDLGFSASPRDLGELDVELSPWAPLLGMLESTEPEVSPGDRPFTPGEGAEGAHALELRAESMRQYAERGAVRTGTLDRTEVGDSDDNRDVVAGRDEVDVGGMLDEHTGHGLVVVADEVEMNVGGPLTMHAHLEDNIIMAGVMRDEFEGGTFITAAMSDDMAAGVGLRCTAPLDVWVHGLVGMEERPGTCAADGLLSELAGTLYEREYGPSAHMAAVARLQGTTVTTMKSGFRPLMKVALGVRNLIPGGGGGGGSANASPPAAPPVPPGGEAAGTLQSVGESGGALVRGGADSGDTDDIVAVVRTVENSSDTADVENLQHPASTADNLDDLARVDAEGGGYRQVAEIYGQPVPAGGWVETEDGKLHAIRVRNESPHASRTLDGSGAHRLADSEPDGVAPLAGERRVSFADPEGAAVPGTDAASPLPSAHADTPPGAGSAPAGVPFPTPRPDPLDLAEPGTEGYDFGRAYDSLLTRQQHYRDHTNWRGNMAVREAVEAVDKRALELFKRLHGSLDDVSDGATPRTVSIRNAIEAMAEQADAAGYANRLAEVRGAADELDELLHGSIAGIHRRADEFTGAAPGAQRVPIDRHVDTAKLRSWLQEQFANAVDKHAAAETITDLDDAAGPDRLAGWEMTYWDQTIRSLDKNVNPLCDSGETMAHLRTEVDAYYKRLADPGASLPESGANRLIPPPKEEYQLTLYVELESRLVATLRNPEYIRNVDETSAARLTTRTRRRFQWGLDIFEPDTLRLAADGEVPPPLPAPGASGRASGLDDARNASFSRRALEASEETLVRRVLEFGGLDVPGPGRQASSGADSGFGGTPATSPGFGRAPPDTALPPVIEEQSGLWIVESTAELDASAAASNDVSAPAHRAGTSSTVSWDSGLRQAGDSEVGPIAGDAHTSDLFRPASEPVDEDAGEVRHVDATASANRVRNDFEAVRAMNENRPPQVLDGSGLGRQWARPVTNFGNP